jgi:uncharacterized sodium:solute symporter family permease YidK
MYVPDFILKFFGRKVADKLDLQEDSKMDTKPWYKSKTILSAIVAALIGLYNTFVAVKGLPVIPDWVFTILAAVGVYSRATADTKIG